MDISKLIDAYDSYFGDDEIFDPNKLTDEQIDEIIDIESDMGKAVDSLIIAKKLHANRRQIAEKKEKLANKVIARILKRIWKQTRESEDGKAKFCKSHVFEVDMEKIAPEFISHNRSKINSALTKGESLDWVTVTDIRGYVRVY